VLTGNIVKIWQLIENTILDVVHNANGERKRQPIQVRPLRGGREGIRPAESVRHHLSSPFAIPPV
jgi:hypothetical protein